MGSDLQYSQIAFLAVVNVFDAIIFSGALFHTLAASHVKLFFAFVDLPTSISKFESRYFVTSLISKNIFV